MMGSRRMRILSMNLSLRRETLKTTRTIPKTGMIPKKNKDPRKRKTKKTRRSQGILMPISLLTLVSKLLVRSHPRMTERVSTLPSWKRAKTQRSCSVRPKSLKRL